MTAVLLIILGCATPPPPLLVLAPGSTQIPVERLVRDWATSRHTDATVVFDDSTALARMVDGGTPADLLLLSDTVRMDGLEDRQHLDPSTRVSLAGDDIAAVASVVATKAPTDIPAMLSQTGPVWLPATGTAEAEAVERLLTEAGVWSGLEARIQHAHDESALMEALQADPLAVGLLSAGRANLGVNVAVNFVLTPAEPPLLIEAAVVAHADRPETAASLLAFLRSPEAEAPFRARGFRQVGEAGTGPPHGSHTPPPGTHRPPIGQAGQPQSAAPSRGPGPGPQQPGGQGRPMGAPGAGPPPLPIPPQDAEK